MNREELNKLFDEHFIDDCNEVYDAKNEIIDFAEKVVKLLATPAVVESVCKEKDTDCAMCEVIYKCNSTDICLHSKQTVL